MPPPPRSALATAPTQNSSVESSLSTFVRSLPRELSRAVKWRIRALSEHTWETELSPVPDGIISLGAHQPLLGAPLDGWIRNLASTTRRYMVTEVGDDEPPFTSPTIAGPSTSRMLTVSSTPNDDDDYYQRGYDTGYDRGHNLGSVHAGQYSNGHDVGYERGYNDAWDDAERSSDGGREADTHDVELIDPRPDEAFGSEYDPDSD